MVVKSMKSILIRYAKHIRGMLSCYDRMLISGTLTGVGHAEGMSFYLTSHGIRLFDFPEFAESLRDEIRENAQNIATANNLEIEFIRSKNFRQDDRIRAILEKRGKHPGLVHIFSSMEGCSCFQPWHNKNTGHTSLNFKEGKCLHYYFYFIHESFGLCFMRVPTWAPFRIQFYCNGHNWLANQLKEENISYDQVDNTFVNIANFPRAQELSDAFPVKILHQELNRLALLYCPAIKHFMDTYPEPYHWSMAQVEYSTDIVFKSQKDLASLYSVLVRTAIHAVKADNVATFLGRKLHSNYEGEVGNNFHTRIEGTRIKHHMGWASIKMYDKHGIVLRIETTVNDVTFFKHYREVVHRDNTTEMKLATMKKTIYSLDPLRELLLAANGRYLNFLSDLMDPSAGIDKLDKLSEPAHKDNRTFRGFNLFERKDLDLFVALMHGEWNITGFHNRNLRRHLIGVTGPQLSRILKRLHLHGIIRKVGKRYKYYLTKFGQQVILAALKVRELVLIPALATQP
jgi:uncharacterized protein YdcH (DUF465 family)